MTAAENLAASDQTLAMEVRRFLAKRTRRRAEEIADELELSSAVLGLDSLAIFDLLVHCEERFGLTLDSSLLEGGPLTVGELVRRILHAPPAR